MRQDFHTGYGMFSLWFNELWVTVHWIAMKTCRILWSYPVAFPYENVCRTGFRYLSNITHKFESLAHEHVWEQLGTTIQHRVVFLSRQNNPEFQLSFFHNKSENLYIFKTKGDDKIWNSRFTWQKSRICNFFTHKAEIYGKVKEARILGCETMKRVWYFITFSQHFV